jgi:hypothetical protein
MPYVLRKNRKKKLVTGERGAPGLGFKLNLQGDYDIDNKKLTNIKDPTENTDAVNFKIFKDLSLHRAKVTGKYDAKRSKISNVLDPTADSDVVNLKYLNNLDILKFTKNTKYISLNKYRFTDCGDIPDNEPDTLIPRRLALCLSGDDNFSAQNKIISNVQDPINANDVVNLKYLNTKQTLCSYHYQEFKGSKLNERQQITLTQLGGESDFFLWDNESTFLTKYVMPLRMTIFFELNGSAVEIKAGGIHYRQTFIPVRDSDSRIFNIDEQSTIGPFSRKITKDASTLFRFWIIFEKLIP